MPDEQDAVEYREQQRRIEKRPGAGQHERTVGVDREDKQQTQGDKDGDPDENRHETSPFRAGDDQQWHGREQVVLVDLSAEYRKRMH